MKSLACILLAATAAFAQPATTSATDAERQALLAEAKAPRPIEQNNGTRRERLLATDAQARQLLERARAYLAKHPAGRDRAEVVMALYGRSPLFIRSIDPRYDADGSASHIVYDEAARDAFSKEVQQLLLSVRDDESAGSEFRLQAGRSLAMRAINSAGTPAELEAAQAQIEKLAAEGLEARSVEMLQSRMFYPYSGLGMAAYEAYLDRMSRSSLEVTRKLAAEAKATLDRQRNGLDRIKFTAADGRAVDLAKLRGKVVLVDFWATWCGPCIAELPHVLETYAKYHDKGFEIVGISFENPGIVTEAELPRLRQRNPDAKADTPDEVARKMEASRAKLLKFTAEHNMPWPQHFDGKYWQNEFGTYFGIRAIPAMFLIDREGRLVNTAARGEKLESEVKRLLGL